MDFLALAKNRYSCKKFSDRPVEREKLAVILEAGRWAPTARNFQEQRVFVVESPEGIGKIDKVTPCRYGAPTVLVVCYDTTPETLFVYPGGKYNGGAEDASIVATHMMLAAADQGVDSCWLNYFDPDAARETLGLPANVVPVMLLDLGYAAEGTGPLPNHSRKPLEETVKYL